jgi:O-antigen biosynthesis protein
MLDIIRFFQLDNWQITFASAAALSTHRFNLQELCIDEKIIELNSSRFDEFINELQPNAVLFDRFFTEEQFGWRVNRVCPDAVKILDTEDLHSLRNTRHRLLKEKQKVFSKESDRQSVGPVLLGQQDLYQEMIQDELTLRELSAIYRCDISLLISSFEMELLQSQFAVPADLLAYCPYHSLSGLPYSRNPVFDHRQHFLFAGNFRHEPNWDAVLWLKHVIWPGICQQLPQAELHIYGAYPPPKAMELHKPAEGFFIKGWADDLILPTQNTRVVLAPLRFGAGLKGKLFEAIKCCTPSVTSSIGAEGIMTADLWPGVVADTAEDFISASVSLYQNADCWWEAQRKFTIDLFKLNYDPFVELTQRVNELGQSLIKYRAKNLTGKLLRQETLGAHKYMSLWIEAKNKDRS